MISYTAGVLEEAEESEGCNASVRATALSNGNKMLWEEDTATKAKNKAEAKVKKLLKDKLRLKELHQKSKTEVSGLKVLLVDAEVAKDAAVSERTSLSTNVDSLKQ